MIDHVNAYALTVRDVKGCAEFYRDKLGLKLQEMSDDFAYLTFDKKGLGVALVSAKVLAQEIPKNRVRPDKSLTQRNYFAVFLENANQAVRGPSREGGPIRPVARDPAQRSTIRFL